MKFYVRGVHMVIMLTLEYSGCFFVAGAACDCYFVCIKCAVEDGLFCLCHVGDFDGSPGERQWQNMMCGNAICEINTVVIFWINPPDGFRPKKKIRVVPPGWKIGWVIVTLWSPEGVQFHVFCD